MLAVNPSATLPGENIKSCTVLSAFLFNLAPVYLFIEIELLGHIIYLILVKN